MNEGESGIIRKVSVFFAFLFVSVCAYAADDPVVATKGYVDAALSTNSAGLAQTIANAVQNIDSTISTLQPTSDKTTTISATSTDAQYPSAKAVYTIAQNYQPTADKTTAISATSTDAQYPSAKAVYTLVQNDPRFNSLPSTAPTGNPPTGRFYIWIEN